MSILVRLLDALPAGLLHWSARVRAIFRPLWFIALAAAVAGVLLGEYHTTSQALAASEAFGRYGLVVSDQPPVRLEAPFDADAARAGAMKGQAIRAIDGVRVAPDAAIRDVARLLARRGDKVSLTVSDPGAAPRTIALRSRDPEAARRWIALRTAIVRTGDSLAALGLLLAAVLLFARRGDDPVAGLLSLSFLLLLASYGWSWLLEVAHWDWLVAILRPTAWMLLNFVLFVFPDGRFQPPWTKLAALVLLPLQWAAWMAGESFGVVAAVNAALLMLAILAIRQRFRILPDAYRQQIKFAFLGFAVGATWLLVAIIADFFVPALTTDLAALRAAEIVRALALIAMIASFALGLLVSLLRYRLYDADAILSRSAAYAVLTVMIGAIWAAGESGVEKVIELGFGQQAGASAAFVAAGIAAVVVAPAHRRVHNWAEKRFQRALQHLRKGLPAFVDDMRETAEPDQLVEATLQRIEVGVRARHSAALATSDTHCRLVAVRNVDADQVSEWMARWKPGDLAALECERNDPLFPIRIRLAADDRQRGWILLGPRPDGSFFGKDEREALAEIAEPISRAIAVAERREARWAKLNAVIDALERRLRLVEETPKAVEPQA